METFRDNTGRFSTSNLHHPDNNKVYGYLESYRSRKLITEEFERRFSNYHTADHCVSFSTGFWALVASVICKSTPGKSNVIMPSMTYRRLADVVSWAGKKPHFVDIEPKTLAISPGAIKSAINSETALILAVHPIVNCCNVDEILDIAKTYSIPVIFDAVESVHETYKGNRIGSFGVGEVFSLHASKLINGIEGGYVCSNDEQFVSSLRQIKNLNSHESNTTKIQSDINPIHSAFALAGLDELEKNVSHNKSVYRNYQKELGSIDSVRILEFDENETTAYKNIVIEVLDSSAINRDRLVDLLNSRHNIQARKHYSPPLHQKKMLYDSYTENVSNSDIAEKRYLNLPCGQKFSPEDTKIVTALIEKYTKG